MCDLGIKLHTKNKFSSLLVLEKKIFKMFYGRRFLNASRSCDQGHFDRPSFPHPKESPYEIRVHLAQ